LPCQQPPDRFAPVVVVVPGVPKVPVIVDAPVQGVVETPGTGMPMNVLSPGALSSVEPSGIVLPPMVVPSPAPEEDVTAMFGEPTVAPEPQVLPGVEPDVAPPPSKVELDPAIPLPVAAIPVPVTDIPVLDAAVPMPDVTVPGHDVAPASGLVPPMLSSVAPSGMPIGPDGALKFMVPSGDVAPMPGVGPTCAKPLPQPRRKMSPAMVRIRRIEASLSVCAPQDPMRRCHRRPGCG
jgi:hypothetical protein